MTIAVDVAALWLHVRVPFRRASDIWCTSLGQGKGLDCSPMLYDCLIHTNPCAYRVQKYIERITEKTKPRRILVCMIYYPDENRVPSWANPALGALGYNSNPLKLQMMIRKAFVEATAYVTTPFCAYEMFS